MNLYPATRINAVEQIETALKVLTSQGYDTKSLWIDHNAWLESVEAPTITDEDRRWAVQASEPAAISDHFVEGMPEALTAARCHVGRQYTLTPGQRQVLLDRYGMTPTKVVIAANVQLYPEDDVIYSLTLKSMLHVSAGQVIKAGRTIKEGRRTQVLTEVVLSPASHFFRDAAIKDKEREDEKVTKEGEKKERVVKEKVSIALQYI